MRVLVLAEYYPRSGDPVRGVWAHRQALAAAQAGAELRVLVLHRPIPPLSSVRARDAAGAWAAISQPADAQLDGLQVDYLRYLSPPRPLSYGSWGAWAAPVLRRALRSLRERFAFELIHAHYAVPSGDAARRAAGDVPLIVSVHGHDVQGHRAGGANVRRTLAHARLALANSAGTAERCAALGASASRVVHLGSDLPAELRSPPATPTLVTVANLVPRKHHAEVIRAVAALRDRHPELRYVIVGDGPERERLRALASTLQVSDRVELRGPLPHERALEIARGATLFVMPSVEEAFGVAYVEAMAAGVPAIGCEGEDGPAEIERAGGGIALVPAGDARALAERIDVLLSDRESLEALGREARATVAGEFTWERCGIETVAAYREVLGSSR